MRSAWLALDRRALQQHISAQLRLSEALTIEDAIESVRGPFLEFSIGGILLRFQMELFFILGPGSVKSDAAPVAAVAAVVEAAGASSAATSSSADAASRLSRETNHWEFLTAKLFQLESTLQPAPHQLPLGTSSSGDPSGPCSCSCSRGPRGSCGPGGPSGSVLQ